MWLRAWGVAAAAILKTSCGPTSFAGIPAESPAVDRNLGAPTPFAEPRKAQTTVYCYLYNVSNFFELRSISTNI